MPDALVLNMQMGLSLKVVAVVDSYLTYLKWELLDDVVDKIHRFCLHVPVIDLEGENTRAVRPRGEQHTSAFRC